MIIGISTPDTQNPKAKAAASFLASWTSTWRIERLGCLAVEQLEDGQALVGGLALS